MRVLFTPRPLGLEVTHVLDRLNILNGVMHAIMQTITRGLFVWTVLFGVCCMQAVPPQPAQSGLISGTIIAAGSIGIAALAASAALAAMSDRENSKNCNCKDQPQEPETTCDVVLAAERQKCEEEKKALESEVQEDAFSICKTTNQEICEEVFGGPSANSCTACLNKFEDESGCNGSVECVFMNGVCIFDD
ncbi:uncharacterized protein LOC128192000 isoform X2 [Crassostrea angulata]|uniref:uncharacterized protein LOC128192000 isoform X2 n=1 Tax=Magallana angulata TaxID=2784310 RepID=UPI0022B1698F|nr:uncharacterized protein LOC128192000 isoform X2 [Crassostrea angulata]